ncbi:MAG: hypothetical protein CMK74_03760 [Pseudomonadales bacterium]|nr:hypothetical protein [Pseudomonadales bacterium]|tara:strand:+ start:372 stop:689 length:318 start_codon:yes stop_codon:yes gene_type:complete
MTVRQWNEQKAEIWQAGFDAEKFGQCPFASGQEMHGVWVDGFVAARLIRPEVPEDTPVFIAGRIARLQGLPFEERPETEPGSTWMAGWVKQGQIPLERIAPERFH